MPPDGDLSYATAGGAAESFEPHRRRLTSLAYRMLGSLADAQDIVQDAFLRWQAADRAEVRSPGAWLSRVVTRLAVDQLKSARARRETYVGPWLPEPIVEDLTVETIESHAQDLSFAMMLALERLSPLERAAFLLHDVFDVSFAEIADTLGRSEAACRQLAARARSQIRKGRPRFRASEAEAQSLLTAFYEAARSGDTETLGRVLAEDVVCHTDGGGKRLAALNVVVGRAKIQRFYRARARKTGGGAVLDRFVRINGLPGYITTEADGLPQATALEIVDGRIVAIYVVRNPDKLQQLRT